MLSLSQGGWEIDIVITVMAVLNKYKDAVLLGEPYLSSGTLWSKTGWQELRKRASGA